MIRRLTAVTVLAPLGLLAALAACGTGEKAGANEAVVLDTTGGAAGTGATAGTGAMLPSETGVPDDSLGEVVREDLDRQIFEKKMALAREQQLDTLPIGRIMTELGRTFVGTKYTPHTLEIDGPERLVLNLRELDCVTFVENMLAMARTVQMHGDFQDFQKQLRAIRYRNGRIDGYPSRLHYFSEWIRNNQAMGLVTNVTEELGGVRDTSRLDFMTTHADAYRQLGDTMNVQRMREIERRISAEPRWRIPQSKAAAAEAKLQDGDIIAMTSTVEGLDVAHTGLAIRMDDGRFHLLNAPLVGKSVMISEQPIPQRLAGIPTQDGMMVARPQPVKGAGGR